MKAKESARYLKIVEWSDEDQCFIGSAPGMIGSCCHGDDEAAVYAELCQIVDEWIEIYKQDGRPLPAATAGKTYSGKFMLRADPELHQRLVISALQHGQSLNKFCVEKLGNSVMFYPTTSFNDEVELPESANDIALDKVA